MMFIVEVPIFNIYLYKREIKMLTTKENKILGAFYGQALGDAMGMPSELWSRSRVQAHFGWIDKFLDGPKENNAACYFKRAQFTDDTAMALALADAIIECNGEINPLIIGQNIIKWADSCDAFNKNILGPTSKIALNALKAGKSIDQLENNGLTNGAAMRVSPLGCLLPTHDLNNFIEQIALASSPTHKSDIALAGAATIAWAISKAIDGESWINICDSLGLVARLAQERTITTFSPSMAARIGLALSLVRKGYADGHGVEQIMSTIYDLIGAGISAIESVPAAIAMVALAKTDPNRCAILCANLGGDTDTIGAMATSICGALNGVSSIDLDLKNQLDQANKLDFTHYSYAFLHFRNLREIT